MRGRVLSIAGSDSSGGAGIQADIKTISALGGYAMTAITCITAQNTLAVMAKQDLGNEIVIQQIQACMDDIGVDAFKTGLLPDGRMIQVVAQLLKVNAPIIPLVVDPVMQTKGGTQILGKESLAALIKHLLPITTLVTPNIPEAAAITHKTITTVEDMQQAAETILSLGPQAVLLKGGHLESDRLVDILLTHTEQHYFEHPRIATQHTHGTGCTLSAAIATSLAQGLSVYSAVQRAQKFLQLAILHAPGYGQGHGPLNHEVEVIE